MTHSSPYDARGTMDPGRPRGPAPGGQPAPLDSALQQKLNEKPADDAPLHASSDAQPHQAGVPATAEDLPAPESALEGLGKAIIAPIRGAAEDEAPAQPSPGGVRP